MGTWNEYDIRDSVEDKWDRQRRENESLLNWAIQKEIESPGWVKKYVKEIVPADKVTCDYGDANRWW